VLEAHVTLSQDDQATSGMGGIAGVVCDGRSRIYQVRVPAQQGSFHRGKARASPFVLVRDPATDTTESAGSSRIIQLR
jgi:hypothetical protein